MKMTMTVRTFFALTPFLHSHLTHCTPALFLWGYEHREASKRRMMNLTGFGMTG